MQQKILQVDVLLLAAWGLTEAVPATATFDLVSPMNSVGTLLPNTSIKVRLSVRNKQLTNVCKCRLWRLKSV